MSFILSFSLIEINSFTLFFSLSFIQVAQSSPSHDEEEEDSHQGPVPDSAKSQNDKSTSKKKRNVPPVKFEPPDEESTTDEDAEPTRYFVFYVFHFIILFHFCFL